MGGSVQVIKNYIWTIINAPWFSWAIFMCSVSVLGIQFLMKNGIWIYMACIPLILFIPDRFNLIWFKFMFPYFTVGYLWNKYDLNIKVGN